MIMNKWTINASANEDDAWSTLQDLFGGNINNVGEKPERLSLAISTFSSNPDKACSYEEYSFSSLRDYKNDPRQKGKICHCACGQIVHKWVYAVNYMNGNILRLGEDCYHNILEDDGGEPDSEDEEFVRDDDESISIDSEIDDEEDATFTDEEESSLELSSSNNSSSPGDKSSRDEPLQSKLAETVTAPAAIDKIIKREDSYLPSLGKRKRDECSRCNRYCYQDVWCRINGNTYFFCSTDCLLGFQHVKEQERVCNK
jgi:hypothetical protein